jgi:hypothetical protein
MRTFAVSFAIVGVVASAALMALSFIPGSLNLHKSVKQFDDIDAEYVKYVS